MSKLSKDKLELLKYIINNKNLEYPDVETIFIEGEIVEETKYEDEIWVLEEGYVMEIIRGVEVKIFNQKLKEAGITI